MTKPPIGVEQLQEFLICNVPSFRDDCLANRALMAESDNFYHLLQDFNDHISRLYKATGSSDSLARALEATNVLLERGTPSVKDATVIQVIDMMMRDDALRTVVLKSGFGTLARTTADQVRNWEKWSEHQRR
jgi:hypothetical protein